MIAIVTGATSGIGQATALLLSAKGYKVYSIARSQKDIEGITYLKADVTDTLAVTNAINLIASTEGRIDLLVNNAGIGISGATECHSAEEISRITAVNLNAVVTTTNATLPYLRQSKGKIINIGSIAGELPIPFQTMYSATKGAIHSYTMALYNELRPLGVKVCCVMPGDTKTSFTSNRHKSTDNGVYQQRVERSVSRMEYDEQHGTNPDKVAKVVYRCAKRKYPPIKTAVGLKYKLLLWLSKKLPLCIVNYILYLMYGK